MTDTKLAGLVTFIYLGAFFFYLAALLRGTRPWATAAAWLARGGFLLHSASLLLRWRLSFALGFGHPPLSNFYESLVFFSWSIVFVHLIVETRSKTSSLGVFLIPLAFLVLAYAGISPAADGRIQPLIPALQSDWLTIHVLTCFLGYAFFSASFALGLLILMKGQEGSGGLKKSLAAMIPAPRALEELLFQTAFMGLVFLGLGILTGAVWAHYAWGSYWSWDPKETWSLITWLIFALLLHLRRLRGWEGRRLAWLAVLGFAAVLFTYLGVNYLPSLHSYL